MWRGEGTGLATLALALGLTFVLGPALQILAARNLGTGDYATFAVALGVANGAGILGGVIQPVVAFRRGIQPGAFMISGAGPTAIVAALLTVLVAAAFAPSIGVGVAALVAVQLPLQVALHAGLGGLQRRKAFVQLAVGSAAFAPLRLLFAGVLVAAGAASAAAFVSILPLAIVASIGLVALFGGFQGLDIQSKDGRLLRTYAGWASVAVLLNVDVVAARLFLGELDAGRYAVAFTLGRLAVFAAGPLATVLLQVAGASSAEEFRRQNRAVFLSAGVLGLAMFAAIGVAPDAVVELVLGHDVDGYEKIVRLQAAAGTLAALVLLQSTLRFGHGTPPSSVLMLAAAISAVTVAAIGGGTTAVATAQISALGAVALWQSRRPGAAR